MHNYHYDIILDKEFKADLYNIINKSVPARCNCYIEAMTKYDEKTKQRVQYRNISVQEQIQCIFKTGKKVTKKNEKTGEEIKTDVYEYITFRLPPD